MAAERLSVILELVSGQYKREAKEAALATGQIGNAAKTSSTGVGALGSAMSSMKGALLAGAAAAAGAAIVKFGADALKAASNLEESMNAVNVVFGSATDQITTFGETAATTVGLAQAQFQQMATVLGAALSNAGFAEDEMADKTIELTQRAADMASVFNTEVPDALGAIQAALRGEADPIEKYGVSLGEAAVKAEAAALGFRAVGGEFTTQAKTAARLSLILKQTDRVAGDFANTSGSLANQSKSLNAQWIDMQARVGEKLGPSMSKLLDTAQDLLPTFEGLAIAVADLVGFAGDLISVAGGASEEMERFGLILEVDEERVKMLAELLLAEAHGFTVVELQARLAAASITDASTAAREAPAAIEPVIVSLGDLESVAGPARDRVRELKEQYTGLTDAMLEAANPILRAVSAMEDLAEVRADPDATVFELADAVISAQSALTALGNGNLAAGIDIIAEAVGQTNDQIVTALENLGVLDGTEVTVLIGFDAEPFPLSFIEEQALIAAAKVSAILSVYGLPPITSSPTGVGGFSAATLAAANDNLLGGKAAGGPVMAGGAYMVGEMGPELFIPQASGSIVSNNQLSMGGNTRVTQFSFLPAPERATDLQWLALMSNLETLVS